MKFVELALLPSEVEGRHVLEAGSRNVNGSVRPSVESLGPASYLGIDIEPGPGVDEICRVEELSERYGPNSFDVVISTELLEHVKDWRTAVSNLKTVVRPTGALLVTTRSRGFKIHGYPYDFWRFEPDDIRHIFGDFNIDRVEQDDYRPGVFVKARKPKRWTPADLTALSLYSVVKGKRVHQISARDEVLFKALYRTRVAGRAVLPSRMRAFRMARGRNKHMSALSETRARSEGGDECH